MSDQMSRPEWLKMLQQWAETIPLIQQIWALSTSGINERTPFPLGIVVEGADSGSRAISAFFEEDRWQTSIQRTIGELVELHLINPGDRPSRNAVLLYSRDRQAG